MSWAGPDREHPGTEAKVPKPYCAERPTPSPEFQGEVNRYLMDRGLNPEVAVHNYWYPTIQANDGELRVVIPCTSANLTNRYWQARLLDDTHITERIKRYTSPRGVSRGDALAVVWPKRHRDKIRGTVLVEGPMDALAAAEVGLLGIAWMGTTPGEEPILFAHRLLIEPKPVFVIQDRGATSEAVEIWKHFPGAFLLDPYPHKDLAEMSVDARSDLLWM